jgi:hypothetical protein
MLQYLRMSLYNSRKALALCLGMVMIADDFERRITAHAG